MTTHSPFLGELDRQLFDNYPAPTFIVDDDVRLLLANRAGQLMLGAGADPAAIAGRLGEVLHCVESAGPGGCGRREHCAECVVRNSVGEALASGSVHRSKTVMTRRNEQGGAEEIAVLVSATPYEREGRRAVLLTLENQADVHLGDELGRMERALRDYAERLRLFVEYAPAAVAMFDRKMRYLAVSRRYATDYRTRSRDLLGRSHYDVFPEIPDRWREIHRRCLAGAVEKCDEDPFPRPDGTVDWVRWEIHPWRDFTGEIGGIILFSEVVTQRKQAEDRLAAERERLAVTLQSIGDAVIATDGRQRVTAFNAVAEQLTGWTAAEAMGRPLEEVFRIVNEDTRQPVENPADRVLREGAVVALANHTALVARDGTERPIADSGAPIRDASGHISGVVLVFRDQTEERRAQAAQARLAAIVESSYDAIVSKDLQGRILTWNAAAERLLGYREDEMVGRPVELIIPPNRRVEESDIMARIRKGERVINFETQRLKKDGGSVDVAVTVWPLRDGEGRVQGASKMLRDVTEQRRARESLRQSEEQYRLLFAANPNPMFVFDEDSLRFLAVNDAAVDAYGWSREEFLAMTVLDVRASEDRARAREVIEAHRGAHETTVGVFRHRRKDETLMDMEVTVSSISLAGRPGRLCAMYDVTERKRAEEALREADQRKTEFLAVLSHELRNPLAPIRNSVHLLRHAPVGSEQAARAKEVIGRQVEQLTRLVDDLLDVTRIERGKIELERTRLDARDVLRATCDDHRTLFEGRGIELRVEMPPGAAWIDADRTRIAQAVGNLLQNAAKFSHEGGTVVASVGAHDGKVELRVRDGGIGIPAELMSRVFEPFVQADGGLARPKGGLGLGLALVKGLVELHGGTVSAHSDGPGRGSEFAVVLPLAAAPQAAAPAPPPASGTRGLSILVIEDNVDAAQSLAEVLRLEGHRVHVATDGLSGIAKAREVGPDVILSDIGLPDLDGYELARALRSQGLTSTRLIALSGYAQPEDRQRAREAGFDDHISKPPSMDVLLAAVAGGGST